MRGVAAPGTLQRLLAHLPPALAIAGLLIWWNRVLISHFYGLLYAWADLSLINDWYSNALLLGRPFWISELQFNHLRTHFTPTVFLALPAYVVTESQYVLVALGTAAVAAALWIGHLLWIRPLRDRFPAAALGAASAFLVVFIGANRYVREVLDSAHIEVFAVPIALAFFAARLRDARTWVAVLLFALALGVREESGLFLGAQAAALCLLPVAREKGRRWRLQNLAFAAVALAYVLFVVKVVNPYVLGVPAGNHVGRGWAQWGDSWPGVAWAIATSPGRTFAAVADSAFLPLNASFGFLPWLHPLAALLVNLPPVLLYCGSEPYQKYLWYYNASFVLPGFLLLVYAGGWRIADALERWRNRPALRSAAGVVLVAAAAAALLFLYRDRNNVPEGTFARLDYPDARGDAELVRSRVALCDNAPTVSIDVRRMVYVPLSTVRYSLSKADRADIAFVFRDADLTSTGASSAEELWTLLDRDPGLRLEREDARSRVYVRAAGLCDGAR